MRGSARTTMISPSGLAQATQASPHELSSRQAGSARCSPRKDQRRLRCVLWLAVAVIGVMAGSANAAVTPISVNGTAGPFTFDTQPGFETGWSTLLWTGNSVLFGETLATVDAKVQTLGASLFVTALGSAAGTLPAAVAGPARWNSTSLRIFTRPTQDNGEIIMATLTNASGIPSTQLTLDYDLTVAGSTSIVEEVYGHIVYYSLSGTAGSWVQFPGGPQADNTLRTFHKTLTADLSATPWPTNATLYVLWVDDNGSGTPDNSLEIDNVTFTVPALPSMPAFANSADPANRTVAQCGSTTFTNRASGNPLPTYQWYFNDVDHPIGGATGATYTIASAAINDAGIYFVQAVNSQGAAE